MLLKFGTSTQEQAWNESFGTYLTMLNDRNLHLLDSIDFLRLPVSSEASYKNIPQQLSQMVVAINKAFLERTKEALSDIILGGKNPPLVTVTIKKLHDVQVKELVLIILIGYSLCGTIAREYQSLRCYVFSAVKGLCNDQKIYEHIVGSFVTYDQNSIVSSMSKKVMTCLRAKDVTIYGILKLYFAGSSEFCLNFVNGVVKSSEDELDEFITTVM